MTRNMTALALALALSGLVAIAPDPLSAQGRPQAPAGGSSSFAFGLAAGGGAANNKRLNQNWDFGPVFGGRFEYSWGQSSALLNVDVQPFWASRTQTPGDFRAVYILPSLAGGPPGGQFGFSLGVGVFDLRSPELGDEGRKAAFVAALFGSTRITQTLSLELGWKRLGNVGGLKGSLYTLQLVQRWRF
jgi:hypothetical protein